MDVTGTIVSGLGEGALYVKQYNRYFRKRLGWEAFPGTLNLKVSSVPELHDPVTITPEEEGLHPVECFDVIVNNKLRGVLVRPAKADHQKDVFEILAPQNIKEYFSLNDGDEVKIRLL